MDSFRHILAVHHLPCDTEILNRVTETENTTSNRKKYNLALLPEKIVCGL